VVEIKIKIKMKMKSGFEVSTIDVFLNFILNSISSFILPLHPAVGGKLEV
jgi:hypothetical protein